MVARDCILSMHTGMPVHICHLSTKVGVEIVTWAKAMGAKVTAEVTPHHLYLTDEEWLDFDCKAKVSPPLREHEDIEALRWALASGIIDIVATDHAPHAQQEKMQEHTCGGDVNKSCKKNRSETSTDQRRRNSRAYSF